MSADVRGAMARVGRCGFTLVEVIIAVGIFATVALGIVGLLATGTDAVRDNVSKTEAQRLIGGLEERLSNLGFDQIYEVLRDDAETDFFLYQYAGHPAEQRPDGTAKPVADVAADFGFRKVTGFREGGDDLLADDLVASLGSVFRIRLTPLPSDPDVDAAGYTLPDPNSYKSAGLRVFVRFFLEPSSEIAGQLELESLDEVLTIPMIVPR